MATFTEDAGHDTFLGRDGAHRLADANVPLPLASAQTVIAFPHTGDYRKDVLIESLNYRWNKASPVGTPVTVTFSFAAAAPVYGNHDLADAVTGFQAFTSNQQQVTREVLTRISTEIGINFVEVADSFNNYGQIRFSNNMLPGATAGSADYPYSTHSSPTGTNLDQAGDVFIDVDHTNFILGGPNKLLLHEIGHALGLKHPFNDGATGISGNYLGQTENSQAYSIMSYTVAQTQTPEWFSLYDLLTLQYLYGRRLNNPGDDDITFTDIQGGSLINVNDGGGIDTIDLTAVTVGALVDLREGAFSSIGRVSAFSSIEQARNGNDTALNNVSIAFGSQIENVTGTRAADTFTGNDLGNAFRGQGGNDAITGGGGLDISEYEGVRSAYTISNNAGVRSVTDNVSGRDGTDTLTGIERLLFSDGTLAFDNLRTDAAGKGYLLYRAAFDRAPDASGLGYWVRELDRGADYAGVMAATFITSPEFIRLYGNNTSNAAFLNLVYQNVLDRAPDQGGSDYWLGQLNNGYSRANMLASFAISDENYNSVSPLISDGIFFV
ncbi:MAG: DUF4214 domain-containing protein [Acidimicrobiales bacterium]